MYRKACTPIRHNAGWHRMFVKNENGKRLCSWLLGKKTLDTEQRQATTTFESLWENEVKDQSQQGKMVAGTEVGLALGCTVE